MQATPSSPSPSVSPPSLLQSSFSSSADTPPMPHTPPRGRSRYPSSLANDGLRVPLHRRGTSKTYERLEDLLKEAGYKETRIFTPETERQRGHERVHEEARQSDGKLKNGVDAVVGLLAGLVLGQPHGQSANPKTPRGDRVGQATLVAPPTLMHGTPLDISSTARTSLSQIQGAPCHPPSSTGPADSGRQSNVHPSPARAYLRHIASAPNIPRRRFLAERAPIQGARRSTSNLKNNHRRSPTPPMPPSWLGTVARAVLGFPGARIGGPNNIPSHSPSPFPPDQSGSRNSSPPTSRSSTVRGQRRTKQKHPSTPLKDTTARLRGRSTPSFPTSSDSLLPPSIPSMRSQASPGEVVRINVVCRSAPASRSSSVVGRKLGPESLASSCLGDLSTGSVRGKGKARQSAAKKFRHKNRGRLADSGPSLSDRVEDGFSSYSPGDGDDYDSFSEDEDEGEVDLSKLLVHVRRQHSIKSLQRHLQRASKHQGGDNDSSDVAGTWTLRGGDSSAAPSDVGGRIRRGSVNDGDWGVLIAPGPIRDSRSFHRRREIPVPWTQQSDNSRG